MTIVNKMCKPSDKNKFEFYAYCNSANFPFNLKYPVTYNSSNIHVLKEHFYLQCYYLPKINQGLIWQALIKSVRVQFRVSRNQLICDTYDAWYFPNLKVSQSSLGHHK